jgi:hypothetical protein
MALWSISSDLSLFPKDVRRLLCDMLQMIILTSFNHNFLACARFLESQQGDFGQYRLVKGQREQTGIARSDDTFHSLYEWTMRPDLRRFRRKDPQLHRCQHKAPVNALLFEWYRLTLSCNSGRNAGVLRAISRQVPLAEYACQSSDKLMKQ